jgi:diadenosine tetraphosphatase ApaH/serine/threonine PP2A family protein phosphatase
MNKLHFEVISTILLGSGKCGRKRVRSDLVSSVLKQANTILNDEPSILVINGDFTIVGDIHGNIDGLLRIFNKVGFPDHRRFLFLGDYVDRDKNSVDVITLLFSLKCLFPENIYLIRGNHECRSLNSCYGLKSECMTFYNLDVYEAANKCFDSLPVAAILNDKVFCVHGGISEKIHSREELFKIQKSDAEPGEDHPVIDFLWSDPSNHVTGFEESHRGAGKLFGKDALETFIEELDLVMVVRSHEFCNEGYSLPFSDDVSILTVFSSTNYCNETNDAAIVSFTEEDPLNLKLEILSAKNKSGTKVTLPQFIVAYQESEFIRYKMSDMAIDHTQALTNLLNTIGSVVCV